MNISSFINKYNKAIWTLTKSNDDNMFIILIYDTSNQNTYEAMLRYVKQYLNCRASNARMFPSPDKQAVVQFTFKTFKHRSSLFINNI